MKKPKINKVIRILFLIAGVFWTLMSVWAIRDVYFPTSAILSKHPLATDNFYLFNKVLAVGALLISLLHLWLARHLNRPHGAKWLWFSILAYICLIMIPSFALPIGIPCLVFWCLKNNRTYHFEQGNGEVRETPAEN